MSDYQTFLFLFQFMGLHYLVDNLTNPALLFFFLGLIAFNLKSDLKIPDNSSKFISFIGNWF
jgi:hypothetical protein